MVQMDTVLAEQDRSAARVAARTAEQMSAENFPVALRLLPRGPRDALARVYGFAREPPRGIDVQHYFTTPPGNFVYGQMGAPHRLQQRGPHFIGFVTLVLAVMGVVAGASSRGTPDAEVLLPEGAWVPAAAALALLFAALSLGRDVTVWGKAITWWRAAETGTSISSSAPTSREPRGPPAFTTRSASSTPRLVCQNPRPRQSPDNRQAYARDR